MPDRREDLQLARDAVGRHLRFTTAFCFAVGLVGLFTIGGLSGIMHASPPVDLQQTDTYFVVAHMHYVLIGGSLFGIFAGLYYWWPKMTGRLLDERLGMGELLADGGRASTSRSSRSTSSARLGCRGGSTRTSPGSAGTSGTWSAPLARSIQGVSLLVFLANVARSLRRGSPGGVRPLGRANARVGAALAAARLQLRRAPHGPPPRRPLADQAPRRPRAGPRGPPRARRRRPARSTCRSRPPGRSSRPSR